MLISLQDRAKAVIRQHGGAAVAARALNINRSVLTQLANGKRTSCSTATLRALRLRAAGFELIVQAP